MARVKSHSKDEVEAGLPWPVVAMRAGTGIMILVFLFLLTRPQVLDRIQSRISAFGWNRHGGVTRSDAKLASLFAPQVMYWQDHIRQWAHDYHVNPNLIATIMQIESCGDPYITSGAGAQGLFQVMPLHFSDGENQLDPETNAQSGLKHLTDCLAWANFDVGLAFACYNGGPGVISLPQDQWYQESRDYYVWGSGIYADAVEGKKESQILEDWLAAGGYQLCQSAAESQQTLAP